MNPTLSADVKFIRGETEAAAKAYLEAARDGDVRASFNYGYCLMHGYGVSRNEKEARSFFSFALELDGGFAAYNLASLYLSGLGGAKNFRKAVDLMKPNRFEMIIKNVVYIGMPTEQNKVFLRIYNRKADKKNESI